MSDRYGITEVAEALRGERQLAGNGLRGELRREDDRGSERAAELSRTVGAEQSNCHRDGELAAADPR